jgi:hypothetical protein
MIFTTAALNFNNCFSRIPFKSEAQHKKKSKNLTSDNSGQCISKNLKNSLALISSQRNGSAERPIQTLSELTRKKLIDSKLPKQFLSEGFACGKYINMVRRKA